MLTTIHQAKGLEWPIVCLPNLQGKPQSTRAGFSPRHGALLCDALNDADELVQPLSTKGITKELDQRREAEERRLLYVALTRARERLILSACVTGEQLEPGSSEKFASPLAFLLAHTERTLSLQGEHDCGSYRTLVKHVGGPVNSRTRFEDGEALAASLAPVEIPAAPVDVPLDKALPLSLKATELLAYRRCPQVYRFSQDLEIAENLPRRAAVRGRDSGEPSAVELGNRVHALLERARFDATDTDAELARLLAGEPAEQRDSMSRMLRAVLEGEIGAAVRAAKRVEREWPFALALDGTIVEGVIDLAIQGPDGRWSIVDYKSNDLSRTGRLEYLIDYYTPQLELYALALSRAGLGEVSDCALVFLAGPLTHRWRFDPAERDIGAWARATAARIAERDYATTAGPKCEMCGYRKRRVCDTGSSWRRTEPERAAERSSVPSR
jgi:ATP-dependent exoDNAse (exonuclease V) beta subunit